MIKNSDLIKIYRTLSSAVECTLCLSAFRIFTKIEHILDQKQSLSDFKYLSHTK